MQTVMTSKAALRGSVAVNSKAHTAGRTARLSVVAGATSDSRRAVLTGLVAGAAALTLKPERAQALTPVDLFDDRKVKQNGYDMLDEARDLDLPQNFRDGMTQFRGNFSDTKKRVAESKSKIDKDLEPIIKKAYWTQAREALRLQVGTLRFDLATLSNEKGDKAGSKKIRQLNKDFIAKVEDLDYALRQKNVSDALSKLDIAKKSLSDIVGSA